MTVEISIEEKLNDLILQVVPAAKTVSKYGGILYTLKPEEKEGQFCGVFKYENHVQLSFSNGNILTDDNGLLIGTGKYRRHINFKHNDIINEAPIAALIKESAEISLK